MALINDFLKEVAMFHMDSPNEPIPAGWAICDGSTLTNPNTSDVSQWVQNINPGSTASYTLPDLRNKFILGADPTKSAGVAAVAVGNANIGVAAGAPGPKGSGGMNQTTLVLSQMPSHNHVGNLTGSVSLSDPGHSHTITDPGHLHTYTDQGHSHAANEAVAGAHTHTGTTSGISNSTPGTYVVTSGGGFSISTGVGGWDVLYSPNNRSHIHDLTTNTVGGHTHNTTISSATTGLIFATAKTGITVNSTTTGITANFGAVQVNSGNVGGDQPHDNRPTYYGLVMIMRVKL